MRIEVTQAHIDEAYKLLALDHHHDVSETCPLALAIRSQGYPNALVEEDKWVEDKVNFTSHYLSDEARELVDAFDSGDEVQPVTLEV